MSTRLCAIFCVSITLVMSCCFAPSPVSTQWTAATQLIMRLAHEDLSIADRDSCMRQLQALGHKAIPELISESDRCGPALRPLFASIIESIYRSDAIYLVNPPLRTATIKINDEPLRETHAQVFRVFPSHPYLSTLLLTDPNAKGRTVTIALNRATYWESVSAFLDCTQLSLDPESDGEIVASTTSPINWSKPLGQHIVCAKALPAGSKEYRDFLIQVVSEPGCIVLDSRVHDIESEAAIDNRLEVGLSTESAVTGDLLLGSRLGVRSVGQLRVKGRLSAPFTLRVKGTLSLSLPLTIQVSEHSLNDKLPNTITLDGSAITVVDFAVTRSRYKYAVHQVRIAKATELDPKSVRILVANDDGQFENPSILEVAGSGEQAISRQSELSKPTKLVFVHTRGRRNVSVRFEMSIKLSE